MRVVIVDDHAIVARGLEGLLALERDIQVVARCSSGAEALDRVRTLQPDVVILDLQMPGMSGLDVLAAIHGERLPVRTVLLTASVDDSQLIEALRLGVRGVVLKEMSPALLVQCLRKVHGGERWIEMHSTARALDRLLSGRVEDEGRGLSRREEQIVRLVGEGLRNKEIGERLFISEGTVKAHLHKIYEKLNVRGRMELSLWARDRLLSGPPR